jgi:hypothetical protein
LEPSGVTWKEVREKSYLRGAMQYRKYEKSGFSTPTGKVELHSTIFADWDATLPIS